MIKVAIIDYELGNLYSVKNAFISLGAEAEITKDIDYISHADIAVLPGVGAFGSAIQNLKKYSLDKAIINFIESGKPFIGICLGFQLLFDYSEEFGSNEGLHIIPGSVKRFPEIHKGKKLMIPQIAWNKIFKSSKNWRNTPLEEIKNGEYMYFVHSYYVAPNEDNVVLSITNYNGFEYCSSIHYKNVFGFQFHPEKSAQQGLKIYRRILEIGSNKGE